MYIAIACRFYYAMYTLFQQSLNQKHKNTLKPAVNQSKVFIKLENKRKCY